MVRPNSPGSPDQAEFDSHDENLNPTDGWIFIPEASNLPTEKLPDSADFEKIRLAKANLSEAPERIFEPVAKKPDSAKSLGVSANTSISTQDSVSFKHGVGLSQPSSHETEVLPAPGALNAIAKTQNAALPARKTSSTPITPQRPPQQSLNLSEKIPGLRAGDVLRDLLAITALAMAPTTTFTKNADFISPSFVVAAALIGIAAILLANLFRWVPALNIWVQNLKNPLNLFQGIRRVALLPVLAFAIFIVIADLGYSIPVLFSATGTDPKVGLGVGVSLMILGSVLGLESRISEGHEITEKKKRRAMVILAVLRSLLIASFIFALIMLIGRISMGDYLFSLVTLSKSLGALALGLLITNFRLRTHHTWYIFLVAASSLLVLGALLDNGLRLNFAGPGSFSSSYIWLPFFFAAYAVLVSRAYVQNIVFRYARADWIHYTALAFEFSAIMHYVAAISTLLYTIAIFNGYPSPLERGFAVVNVIMLLLLAVLSQLGRKFLNQKSGLKARNNAVAIAATLIVLGFLGIIILTVFTGESAGLNNGGLAFLIGLAALLMLTMPVPDRDEHGVPDLDATFAKFRAQTRPYFGKTGRVRQKALHERAKVKKTKKSELSPATLPRESPVASRDRGQGLAFLEHISEFSKQLGEFFDGDGDGGD